MAGRSSNGATVFLVVVLFMIAGVIDLSRMFMNYLNPDHLQVEYIFIGDDK